MLSTAIAARQQQLFADAAELERAACLSSSFVGSRAGDWWGWKILSGRAPKALCLWGTWQHLLVLTIEEECISLQQAPKGIQTTRCKVY
jgi:hypothetical protein